MALSDTTPCLDEASCPFNHINAFLKILIPAPKVGPHMEIYYFQANTPFFFPFFSPLILARPNYLCYFPKALGFASTDSPIANRQCGSMHKPWLELPAPDEHLSCKSDIMCVSPTLFVLQPFLRAWSCFPKGSAFVLAAIHALLPHRPLGLRLSLPPLLLLVPLLPPHVPQLHSG